MATTTATPSAVTELLGLLEPFGPFVEGFTLRFKAAPPRGLVPSIRVLQTGLRSRLVGRVWWGCGTTVRAARPCPLNPSKPIPRWVRLLAVEGDPRWDRIRASARRDMPHLFDDRPPGRSTLDPVPALTPDDLPPDWRDAYEERAAIREFDGGLPHEQAEHLALQDVLRQMADAKNSN
jgi:hypothetical protein